MGGQLSINTTANAPYLGHEKFTINTTNAAPFIELFIVINANGLLIVIAPMAVNELASIKWFELGDFCPRL